MYASTIGITLAVTGAFVVSAANEKCVRVYGIVRLMVRVGLLRFTAELLIVERATPSTARSRFPHYPSAAQGAKCFQRHHV